MSATHTRQARALAARVIKIADQPQNVTDSFSHPFSSAVTLECEHRGLKLYVRGQMSGYSNGSLIVQVKQGRATLLRAEGPYMHGPLEIKVYQPGTWTKSFG